MPARRVILAERRAANDNFVDEDRVSNRWELGTWLEAACAIVRVLMTASFSLLVLLLISAIFLLGLALVGLFAAGLAGFRLTRRHLPGLAFPIYEVDRRAPG